MRTMLVWLALSAGAVAHAQPSPPIIVSNSTELQAAVVPGNAGRAILVRAGDYEVGQPLVVPDGATLTGEGVMLALATYLGHVSIDSTYWYLESTPELLADIAAAGEAYLGGGHS